MIGGWVGFWRVGGGGEGGAFFLLYNCMSFIGMWGGLGGRGEWGAGRWGWADIYRI